MGDIAAKLYEGVQYILGFGPTVMLPLVLFILALFFKIKPAKALRSSLTVGIGFVGIYAIFDILTNNVGPAAQAMVEQTGINLPVVDLGWPPLSAITWGSPIAPFVIPLTMLINVIMIAIKQTRTVDVDMWNYWHFARLPHCVTPSLDYYGSGPTHPHHQHTKDAPTVLQGG
jgi:PTS system galactitol-specific IIC component